MKKGKKVFLIIILIITAVAIIGVSSYFIIKSIKENTISSISINTAYKYLSVGNKEYNSTSFNIDVFPLTASNENVVVVSSNPEVAYASYADGVVTITAVSKGTVTITAMSQSNKKIFDSCVVGVDDIVINNLDFVTYDANHNLSNITETSIQKDGVEHRIDFIVDPFNGNMKNLKVSFDKSVFEDAFIDEDNMQLVVIPKVNVVQNSTTVDIELYESTSIGTISAQYVSLQIGLVARTSYLRFGYFAPNSSVDYTYSDNSFVYLDNDLAKTVCIRPQLSSDSDYSNVFDVKFDEYEVLIYENVVMKKDSVLSYTYKDLNSNKNKFTITRIDDDCLNITTLPDFVDGDSYLITLRHIYTEVNASVEIIFNSSAGDYQELRCINGNNIRLHNNTLTALDFSYDDAMFKNLVQMKAVYADNNSYNYLDVIINNKKLYVETKNCVDNAEIKFVSTFSYWDVRYNKYGGITDITVNFSIVDPLSEIYFISGGVEDNTLYAVPGNSIIFKIEGFPFNNDLDYDDIVIQSASSSAVDTNLYITVPSDTNKIQIQRLTGTDSTSGSGYFKVFVGSGVSSGNYSITFKVNGTNVPAKILYITV